MMKVNENDALIVVDVQNDFCPGGALPVPSGDAVVRVINGLQQKLDRVFFTRDWHPQDHCSFAEEPTFEDQSWPTHCVQDSPGAEFHGDLRVPLDAPVISKGTDPDKEAYSGFQGTDLADQLRNKDVQRVFIAGLATDVCVKATTLDALKAGFEAVLVQDGCRGIDETGCEKAIEEMRAAGAQVCISGEVLR